MKIELSDVEAAHLREVLNDAIIEEKDVIEMSFVKAAINKSIKRIESYTQILAKLK